MSDVTTLWYAVVDQAHNIISGENSLQTNTDCTIEQLKKRFIKEQKDCREVIHASLNVYRSSLVATDEVLQQSVSAVLNKEKPLRSAKKLRDCNIGEEEILFVELPWRDIWYCIVDQAHKIISGGGSLQINTDCTIEQLKKRFIKEQKDCREVIHTSLNVYRSSLVATDEVLQQKVSALLNKEKPLIAAKQLRDCNIGEKEILFVELPWVTISYRLVNQENTFEGGVMKVSAASVPELQLCIKDQRPNDLRHVDAAKLIVWRYEPHFHMNTKPESIKNINLEDDGNATALQGNTNLGDLALSDNDMLIVQFPDLSLDKHRRSGLHNSLKTISDLREEQTAAKLTPSEMKIGKLEQLQRSTNNDHILYNRPAELAPPIPVTLLHPILNEFQHDCETYSPQTEDYRFAQELSKLSELYPRESERQTAFLGVCAKHGLDIYQITISGAGYPTDGSIVSKQWPCLIVEFKNEIGATGAEPVFQAAAYYRAYLKSQRASDLKYTCPCIGMYVVGPLMGFFGMAFTTRLNVQILGQGVRVDYHNTANSQWTLLARHLGALRQAVNKLERLYKETDRKRMTMQVQEDKKIFFPAYYHFDTDGRENQVQYISQLLPDSPDKLLFNGKWNGKDIVIKFTQRYSIRAHQSCASKERAPELFGWRELKGGWTMVVMERLDESWKMVSGCTKTKGLFEEIHRALCDMHLDNYVHGDVRDFNIMVKEEGGGYRIKLIDFDWAGEIGQTVYPRNVGDSKLLRRPEGASDGKEIQQAHDLDMLYHMFSGVVECDSPWW